MTDAVTTRIVRSDSPKGVAWRLPAGIHLQPYMDAHGYSHDKLRALLAQHGELGIKSLAVHMGPAIAQDSWETLHRDALDMGTGCGLVIPGDDQTALDGGLQTAADKGRLLGQMALHPGMSYVGIDAEGGWETDTGADDQSTPAKVRELGEAFVRVARRAWVERLPRPEGMAWADYRRLVAAGDPRVHDIGPWVPLITQGWFAIESHASFPQRRFAEYADEEYPQEYDNDFIRQYGVHRHAEVRGWMQRDYARWDRANPDRVNPRSVTLQGYGWDGDDGELDDALALADDAPVILYCEPFPTAQVIAAMRRRMARFAAGKATA